MADAIPQSLPNPQPAPVTVWQFSRTLTGRLLIWSAGSMAAGAALMALGRPFWRGFGVQAVGWGAIDAAIALVGRRSSERNQAAAGADPDLAVTEKAKLARLLWLNARLDVLYVLGGLILARSARRSAAGSPADERRGHGWGIVAQGAFLLVLDLWHALALRDMEAR